MENESRTRFGHQTPDPVTDLMRKVRERSAIEAARKVSLEQLFSKPARDRVSELEGYDKGTGKVLPR